MSSSAVRARRATALVILARLALIPGLAGCDEKPTPAPETRASAPASAPASASAAPAPWHAGRWTGSYRAERFAIEMKPEEGAVAAWEKDDGGVASGDGKVSLLMDADGNVSGESEGALGKLTATGRFEEDTLVVRFSAADQEPDAITSAVLQAKKQGEALSGTIQASSGDSLVVRRAKLELKKQAPETP